MDRVDSSLFSFAVISDVQYFDGNPAGARFYRHSLLKLEETIRAINSEPVSFVVDLGDKIEKDFHSFDSILIRYQALEIPLYHVLGNHDFSVEDSEKERVLPLLNLTSSFYDFTVNGWQFIVLDGTAISLYSSPKGSPTYRKARNMLANCTAQNAVNAIDWNGALGSAQRAWLKEKLKESAENGNKVIILCHFPVHPVDRYNLWDYTDVLRILGKYDHVYAWFNGHNHAGNYGKIGKIHCVTFKGLVNTPDEVAYAIVKVFTNRIEISGRGHEKSRILYLEDGE